MSVFTALIQAVGAIAAAAVAVTLWRMKTNADRADEERRRRQKVDDVVRAVRADIVVELATLAAQFDEPAASLLKTKLLKRLEDSASATRNGASEQLRKDMPQGKSAPQSFVFEIIKSDLTILPTEVVEPVIAYYRLDQRLGSLVDAFSSGVYAGISDERQAEAVEGYFSLGNRTLVTARIAQTACDRFLAAAMPTRPAE